MKYFAFSSVMFFGSWLCTSFLRLERLPKRGESCNLFLLLFSVFSLVQELCFFGGE